VKSQCSLFDENEPPVQYCSFLSLYLRHELHTNVYIYASIESEERKEQKKEIEKEKEE
jgi:hypothetical protein